MGGLGGVPPGGSGAPGWQIPGTRGLLGRSEGRPCHFSRKPAKTYICGTFGGVGGTPRGVWGPRLAESRDPGPPLPVRGATLPIFSENRPKTHIFGFWRCGGYPPAGSGAPGWQNPGTRGLLRRSDGGPANVPEKWQFWGSEKYSQRVWAPAWQIPRTRSLLGLSEGATPPRPTCPVSCPETRKVVLCRLSSNPYRVREAKCLLGALTSRRAAGTGREDPQPDNNPFQLRFCCDTHILCRVRREAESEKAPPGGGLGG